MKCQIVLEGLICTSCAGKVQNEVEKLEYIEKANYSIASQIMEVCTNSDIEEEKILSDVKRIVDDIEDGVVVRRRWEKTDKKKVTISNLLFFVGLIIFLIAVIFDTDYLYLIGYILTANKILRRTYNNARKKIFFDENTLMVIATMSALYIQEYIEAIAVVVLYTIGEYFQNRAVNKSRNEIENLINLKVTEVTVVNGIKQYTKRPEEVEVGDIILVKTGEQVPVDGIVIGSTEFDSSSITGEAMPLVISNDEVLSGYINIGSVVEIKTTKKYKESTLARIIDLVENATSTKTKTEQFITKFAKYYTPIVVIVAFLIVLIPSLISYSNFNDYLYRSAIFLVISCPCALVISVPLSYFAGVGKASSLKVLFKGSNMLDDILSVKEVFLDKTGTLTYGEFSLVEPNDELLRLAASIEIYSNHPLAKTIVKENRQELFDVSEVNEVPGMGLTGLIGNLSLVVGKREFLIENGIEVTDQEANTETFIAYNNIYKGKLIFKDKLKSTSVTAIKRLQNKGIRIHMLTGDNNVVAQEVAEELGIEYRGSLLPEDKLNILSKYQSVGKKMFVGDGINDAPVLKQSDIGVAMGQRGSDLAIEVADVVIMDDNLMSLSSTIDIATFTKRVVLQNIVFALGIKLLFLLLGGFGMTSMWMAIFADVGVSLLAILNALRILYRKYGGNYDYEV